MKGESHMPGDVRIVIEIDGAAPAVLQALSAALRPDGPAAAAPQGAPGTLGDQDAGAAPPHPGAGDGMQGMEAASVSAAPMGGALNAGAAPSESTLTPGMPAATPGTDSGTAATDAAGLSAGAAPDLPGQ
jgi:hypothetical protein